jgi:hypothetical protein
MMGDGKLGFDAIITPPPTYDPLFVEVLWQPVGGIYGPDFNPDDVERTDWGTLYIEFDDDDSAHVEFASNNSDFGSGEFPIQRLARPMLAECE